MNDPDDRSVYGLRAKEAAWMQSVLISELRRLAFCVTFLATICIAAHAQIPGGKLEIGVLSDFSGPFADQVGHGSYIASPKAGGAFAAEGGGPGVEAVFADHQNKPDVGLAIARRWVDQQGVSAIVDLANSGVGLAVNALMNDRNRVMLASATATSDLT